MRAVKATKLTAYVVTFVDDNGKRFIVPMYLRNGRWRTFGSYQVMGVSKSDPTYSAVHALPYQWHPRGKLLAALRKVM